MRRASTCSACLVAVALGWAIDARASGTELPDPSASAAGTGGATTARSGDPAAASYNPAALVDGEGLRVGLGSLFAISSAKVTSSPDAPPPAYSARPESGVRPVPYVAASYSHAWWAAGLSVNVPFGGGVKWPKSWPLRFEARESSLAVVRVAPFVGARWRWLSFAAGPYLDLVETKLVRSTNHVSAEGEYRVAASGHGLGGHAGLFIQPLSELAFGLTYKSRDVVPVEGDVDFDVPAAFAAPFPDQRVSARLALPDRFALGVAWSVLPSVRALADISYTVWSINDKLVLDFERPETPDATLQNEWRDTIALRAGGELDVTRRLTARAGGFVDGLPEPAAPSRNLGPSSADMTRVGGSVGGGLRPADWLAIDAFYQFFVLVPRSSTSNDLPLATYSGTAHVFGLGARFAWNPSSASPGRD
ncbi:MAG: Long-chain fatty acid transport protein [Labilithrix sp.]|nr:Long-chain fatty acid transport protein [Labilithrix sp.]